MAGRVILHGYPQKRPLPNWVGVFFVMLKKMKFLNMTTSPPVVLNHVTPRGKNMDTKKGS